ncbi:protoporphyrinogen oxidase [Kytococcus sedentarius]|uniref:protoporphyrinogen oxidase n=1 Tax=Kytococcus sedentarius TaxID=1276 RepID=UPI0035BC1E57
MGARSLVVVGGGISGLVAAWQLVEHEGVPPREVTVLEARQRVGGVLKRREVAGNPVDLGAESVLTTRTEALDLIEELGLTSELHRPTGVPASVWSRGGFHPVPRGTVMGVPGDPSLAQGLLTPDEVERAQDTGRPHDPVHQDLSVGDFVEQRMGPAVVDRLVEPLLGGVYAGDARRLSLQACIPALAKVAREGTPLVDAVAAMTPRSGGTQARPVPPFASLEGGLGRLPEELARHLVDRGVTLRTGTEVVALERRGAHQAVGWDLALGGGDTLAADAVLLAVPAPAAARLLAGVAPEAAADLAGVRTASMAVVTFAFPAATMPPLERSGFLVPPVDGRAIKAATFSSAKWPHVGDDDVVYVRASLGRAGDDEVLEHGDAALARLALQDLRTAVREDSGQELPDPVEHHVQRWVDGLPQYDVGHVDRVAGVLAAVGDLESIELAGSAYDGVGIPACIATARGAASRLVAGGTMTP